MAERGRHEGGRDRSALRRLAELLTLTAFAFVQPVLDVTGKSPDFFLYRRPSVWQIRLLVAAIVLGPPLGLWAAERVVGLFSRAAERALHLVFVAVLFALILVQAGKQLGLLTGVPLAVVAVAAGIGLAVLAARTVGLRQAMLYAVPAPLLFVLLFVLSSPSGVLVRTAGRSQRGGIPAGTAESRPPIVFLFLDEFPLRALLTKDGQIDAKLFPNFARLAKIANWYPNATGVSGWTPFAAPAMLNGRYPSKVLAPYYLAYPQNLFTWLAGTYHVRAYETISQLCPPSICTDQVADRPTGLYAMAHDTAHVTKQLVSPWPSKTDPTQQFVESVTVDQKAVEDRKQLPNEMFRFGEADKSQPERLTRFLADLKPSDKPTLHFLHLLLPHAPWKNLPPRQLAGETKPTLHSYQPTPNSYVPRQAGESDKDVARDPVLADLAKQRLVLQLGYTDHSLGVLLDRMEATGLLDPSLLIVTADHGAGLTPGSRSRIMDDKNGGNLAWVPVFVKPPGQKTGKVDPRNEQQVDLVPTIADVLNEQPPWQVDGVSMLGPARPGTEKPWYDVPGERELVDPGTYDLGHSGMAAEIAKPELGWDGLYAFGPHKDLVGKKVSDLTVGAPSPVGAQLTPEVDLNDVDPAKGTVPAMIWGRFDGSLGGTESTYVVASVNGTIAGGIPALLGGDGGWRFSGLVNERYFRKGRNEVTLYRVDGTTLHPVPWR